MKVRAAGVEVNCSIWAMAAARMKRGGSSASAPAWRFGNGLSIPRYPSAGRRNWRRPFVLSGCTMIRAFGRRPRAAKLLGETEIVAFPFDDHLGCHFEVGRRAASRSAAPDRRPPFPEARRANSMRRPRHSRGRRHLRARRILLGARGSASRSPGVIRTQSAVKVSKNASIDGAGAPRGTKRGQGPRQAMSRRFMTFLRSRWRIIVRTPEGSDRKA